MIGFLELEERERRQYFEETGNRMGLPPASIEKDFWVCFALSLLFELEDWGDNLTFKGGTSLSKCWKLIKRFSEDIDIVIDRGFLGFEGEKSPENAPSQTACRKMLIRLSATCRNKVQAFLKPLLEDACKSRIPGRISWELLVDADAADGQTLLLRYKSLFAPGMGYLSPQVKIELGARSDTEPVRNVRVSSYLAETFPGLNAAGGISLRAVAPERTFWEKAMLLHEEAHRPPEGNFRTRLSRHYYDLYCLILGGVAENAVKSPGLFERVAEHRRIFFRQNWMSYENFRPGAFRISPRDDEFALWRDDYEKTAREMVMGEPPSFEQIIEVVMQFEKRFNS